jgi:hypothetical protein
MSGAESIQGRRVRAKRSVRTGAADLSGSGARRVQGGRVHLKERLRYRTRAQRAEKMWLLGKCFRRFDAPAWGVDKIMEV